VWLVIVLIVSIWGQGPLVMDDKQDNVFLFAQVSDIHLSYKEHEKQHNFQTLLGHLKNVIKPEFVLTTGDLTDGKLTLWLVKQVPEEWREYQDTMRMFNETYNMGNWVDQRGNHDTYGERESINSPENSFNKHTIYGAVWEKTRVMSFVHQKPYGSYRFVGFDANMEQVTMLNPHNFFGKLYRKDMDDLEKELSLGSQNNHTFIFNHYPLAVIHSHTTSSGKDLFGLLAEKGVLAHFCGHLHSCFGLCPYLQANLDHLELEVQDMVTNYKYRIMAMDHDILAHNDVVLGRFPAVLITNPKDARYLSKLEPLYRMRESTHIRMFVFSPNPILSVQVFIDGKSVGVVENPIGNFVTIPWNATEFITGFHHIKVIASDRLGNSTITEHTFSLDEKVPPLNFRESAADLFLRTYWSTVLQVIFILVYSIVLAFLICLKAWHVFVTKIQKKVLDLKTYNPINARLILFISWDIVYWPYLFFYLIFPFCLWEVFLFGIMELVHTYFPILLYLIYISGSNHSWYEVIVNVFMYVYVIGRLMDSIWNIRMFHLMQIIWPLTETELWVLLFGLMIVYFVCETKN
jgi:hypothetical protein